MRLSVFGLGYVGCVSAACFAREGHEVLGVDVNRTKVDLINGGKSPIVEAGVGELIGEMVARRKLRATTDSAEAVAASEISLVCVGTPSSPDGSLDLTNVERVCAEIGGALKTKRKPHAVVIRSTMLPGTVEEVVVPTLEASSGRKAGRDFGVCINPEFLREGTSLKDFYTPPFTSSTPSATVWGRPPTRKKSFLTWDDSSAAARALSSNVRTFCWTCSNG